jgi:beta-glucosidase
MCWVARNVQSLWGAQSIFITENGSAASDVISDDGKVYDSDQVMFLRACLDQLQRATTVAYPWPNNFNWSSQDNLEWVDGFGKRFGLIYVDFDTLERKPKLSAEWFRQAAQ